MCVYTQHPRIVEKRQFELRRHRSGTKPKWITVSSYVDVVVDKTLLCATNSLKQERLSTSDGQVVVVVTLFFPTIVFNSRVSSIFY